MNTLKVLLGIALFLGSSMGQVLYLPPKGPQEVGYDVAKVVIYFIACWLVYRGIKPKVKSSR